MGAAGSIGVTCLSVVAQLAMNSNSYQQSVQSTYAAPIFVQVVVVGIIIPVAEEMMFRGFCIADTERQRAFIMRHCGHRFSFR